MNAPKLGTQMKKVYFGIAMGKVNFFQKKIKSTVNLEALLKKQKLFIKIHSPFIITLNDTHTNISGIRRSINLYRINTLE